MDNMLVGTEDKKKYNKIVEEVLRRMEENDLYIKPEKYVWKVKEIDFLGLVIRAERIKMQEEKVVGVLKQSRSKIVKEVQKFLGLANYYRRFVKDFAKLAEPLYKLVRKDKKWNWREEQKIVFRELKRVFIIRPVLVVSNLDKEMRVKADASEYATGGVLSIKYEDKKQRPVAFISKSLNKAKRNYKIHDREMLAVIRCLEEQKHLLEGTYGRFEIWNNHKNLEYFISSQKLNKRQVQWALYLLRFDFHLKHVPESSMG